jgi:hypothetical protein
MEALYVLFFRDEQAAERLKALEASLSSAEDHAMFRRLSIGIIDPSPLTPKQLARLRELIGPGDKETP